MSGIDFYYKNPRTIEPKTVQLLQDSLEELGDLSGIVHDLNSNQIIGGNQRSKIFNINQCEIILNEGPHEPDSQGTVALGDVIWKGHKYRYRQVRWTEKQCEEANIKANAVQGKWDWEILQSDFALDNLLSWGLTEADDEFNKEKSTGNLLALIGITLGEPIHTVTDGDIWKLGDNLLVCAEVLNEWQFWTKLLEPGMILATYPGPMAPLTELAQNYRLLMIQPDPFIAGHIIDRFAEVKGEEEVGQLENFWAAL